MASYLDKKLRAFKSPEDPCDLPLNCKSLFHMKTYKSATDPRAWTHESLERKAYIMELFAADYPPERPQGDVGSYSGKFVDMPALMRALLANKDADILRLQDRVALLEQFIDRLKLSSKQREKFEALKVSHEQSDPKNPKAKTEKVEQESTYSQTSRDDLSYKYRLRIEELEEELQYQKSLAHNAAEKLSSYHRMAKEVDNLKVENDQLRSSLDYLRTEKESANVDKYLREKICVLQKQIAQLEARKFVKLSASSNNRVSIEPKEKDRKMRSVNTLTSDQYIDLAKLADERNGLQETINSLMEQIEALQQPKSNPRWFGDHASQHSQTAPNIQVEQNLRQEIKHLRDKLNDKELKQLEFDRLCLRISELQMVEKEHEDMKIKYNIKFTEHRASIMQNVNKIDLLNKQCLCMHAELERYQMFESENDILSERCRHLQSIIDHQKHNRSLIQDSETKINQLKEELHQKSNIIKISEDKLIALQNQLRESIKSLTAQTTDLKKSLEEANVHIADLQEQRTHNEDVIGRLRTDLGAKETLLQAYEEKAMRNLPKSQQDRDNTVEQLRVRLIDLQRDNEQISEMTYRLQSYVLHHKSGSVSENGAPYCHETGHRRGIKGIHHLMLQLCADIKQNHARADTTMVQRLQARFRQIQTLVKEEVQWLAGELRKCKSVVQEFEANV